MYSPIIQKDCFLCSKLSDVLPHQGATTRLHCKNCGEYVITVQAERVLEFSDDKNNIKYILSPY